MALAMKKSQYDELRWFSDNGCVVYRGEWAEVFVAGKLIGSFGPQDILTRNVLLVGLSREKQFKKGRLAAAFGITDQHLRMIRKVAEEQGEGAIPGRARGGSKAKVTESIRKRLYGLFDSGLNANQAFLKSGKRLGLSYRSFCRVRQEWQEEQSGESGTSESIPDSNDSSGGGSREESDSLKEMGAPSPQSGKHVQHLGGFLLVSLVYSYGLYEAAMRGWEGGAKWQNRLRLAFDAVILALGIGQRCVEGVRRLGTSSAPVLLRTRRAPSASWVRRIVKRYVDDMGGTPMTLRMTENYLERARTEANSPAVFYVDNHMRTYTGKKTLRKGWRMQDKRVKAGTTDYYVHDEDGRPLFRVDVPEHGTLTDWLTPITALLRKGLGKEQRILVAFDRAGAFPKSMTKLRDLGFEFVTYERAPYQMLAENEFDDTLTLDGEDLKVRDEPAADMGKGRSHLRRISIKTADGRQLNVLAASKESNERLVEIITGRWVQENGFKHGNERWGINQLDRRKAVAYDPNTVIPNPARRRLDFALRLARLAEGEARRKLAHLKRGDKRKEKIREDLKRSLSQQDELIAQRPHLPTHAFLKETELADELAYHDTHYKAIIDSIRIACANAESELAGDLGPHLAKPREAKKALANLFAATGDIRVSEKSITLSLSPTGRTDEQHAFQQLFDRLNQRTDLSLPGDPKARPLRFKSKL
jgi:hypothetical protein